VKNWDFTAGAAKLDLAMRGVRLADANVEQCWDDAAHQKFRETYLDEMEPKVREMIEALRQLAEIINSAERKCGMD
jgi:hypothetical protein